MLEDDGCLPAVVLVTGAEMERNMSGVSCLLDWFVVCGVDGFTTGFLAVTVVQALDGELATDAKLGGWCLEIFETPELVDNDEAAEAAAEAASSSRWMSKSDFVGVEAGFFAEAQVAVAGREVLLLLTCASFKEFVASASN